MRKYRLKKHFNDCEAFIEYSNEMDDIYKNIEIFNYYIQLYSL